jgi:hypothetical protein
MGVCTTDKTWARDGRGSQGGSIDDRYDGLNVKRILLSASCTFASFDRSISIRNLLPTPAPAPAACHSIQVRDAISPCLPCPPLVATFAFRKQNALRLSRFSPPPLPLSLPRAPALQRDPKLSFFLFSSDHLPSSSSCMHHRRGREQDRSRPTHHLATSSSSRHLTSLSLLNSHPAPQLPKTPLGTNDSGKDGRQR